MAGAGLGTPGVTKALLVVAGLALAAAAAFGLWHVIVGGLVSGNPRAAGFGMVLVLAAGLPLLGGAVLIRIRHPDPG
jgi:hypothetical protein